MRLQAKLSGHKSVDIATGMRFNAIACMKPAKTIRRITMRDIARRLDVSVSTVSRALNGSSLISSKTSERIRKAADGSNYIRNMVARGLAVRSSHLIGLVVSSISNPFFAEIARGVHDVARSKGYVIALCNTERKVEEEEMCLRTLLGVQVDGMIFAGGVTGVEHLKWLAQNGGPFVLAGRPYTQLPVPTVAIDNVAVGYQATQHLISQGHKRIGFLSGPSNSATCRDRCRGYMNAIAAANLTPVVYPGDFQLESGFALASELVKSKRRPTAVFAANDMMAIGLILGCPNLRLRVPDDLAVVGCDDIPMARLIKPMLTTMRVPMYEMGARAMDLLTAELEGKQELGRHNVSLACELIERESTLGGVAAEFRQSGVEQEVESSAVSSGADIPEVVRRTARG